MDEDERGVLLCGRGSEELRCCGCEEGLKEDEETEELFCEVSCCARYVTWSRGTYSMSSAEMASIASEVDTDSEENN